MHDFYGRIPDRNTLLLALRILDERAGSDIR